eukprot:6833241-Pyramimonas_sp.AAC.1
MCGAVTDAAVGDEVAEGVYLQRSTTVQAGGRRQLAAVKRTATRTPYRARCERRAPAASAGERGAGQRSGWTG